MRSGSRIPRDARNSAKGLQEEVAAVYRVLDKFRKPASLLVRDSRLREQECSVYFVIDFAELFRYLHPPLDLNFGRPGYLADQLLLHHLLSGESNVLLVPSYINEYKEFIDSATIKLKEAARSPGYASTYSASLRIKYRFFRERDIERNGSADNDDRQEKPKEDISVLSGILSAGQKRFWDLIASKRLVPYFQLPDIDFSQMSPPEKSHVYDEVYSRLSNERVFISRNNHRDASAVALTCCLNNLSIDAFSGRQRSYFLFFTGDNLLAQTIDEFGYEFRVEGSEVQIPIRRSYEYLFLRQYFEPESGLRLNLEAQENFRDLIADSLTNIRRLDIRSIASRFPDHIVPEHARDVIESTYRNVHDEIKLILNSPLSNRDSILDQKELADLFGSAAHDEDATRNVYSYIERRSQDRESWLMGLKALERTLTDTVNDLETMLARVRLPGQVNHFIYGIKLRETNPEPFNQIARQVADYLESDQESGLVEAIKLRLKLARDFPDVADLYLLWARTYRYQGLYTEALLMLDRGIERLGEDAMSAEHHFEYGLTLRRQFDTSKDKEYLRLQDALHHIEEAMSLTRDEPDARFFKEAGFLEWKMSSFDQAAVSGPALSPRRHLKEAMKLAKHSVGLTVKNSQWESQVGQIATLVSELKTTDSVLLVGSLNDLAYYSLKYHHDDSDLLRAALSYADTSSTIIEKLHKDGQVSLRTYEGLTGAVCDTLVSIYIRMSELAEGLDQQDYITKALTTINDCRKRTPPPRNMTAVLQKFFHHLAKSGLSASIEMEKGEVDESTSPQESSE